MAGPKSASSLISPPPVMTSSDTHCEEVSIPANGAVLQGIFNRPSQPLGIVIFVHGSGSSRFSLRNQLVARRLNEAGLATLLFDLLTPLEEAADRETACYRFDIPLLANRLDGVIRWLGLRTVGPALPVGLFGASTGAAVALIVAARQPEQVGSVVSRGGRPDLAWTELENVRAPSLFIVGGEDKEVIALNRQASTRLSSVHRIEIVPGATHLFEEPGKLEEVVRLSTDWFLATLPTHSRRENALRPAGR